MSSELVPALVAAGGGGVPLAGIVAHEHHEQAAMRRGRLSFTLTFPAGTTEQSAVAALSSLAGLDHRMELVAEVAADEDGVHHLLHVPGAVSRSVLDQLGSTLPGLRAVAADRPSKHEHYLRGTLFCGDCGGRLLYTRNTGNGGTYEYYSCINRRSRGNRAGRCQGAHYRADHVATALEQHYRSVVLSDAKQQAIIDDVKADAEERTSTAAREIKRHEDALATIEAEQEHLIGLSFKGLVSDRVLARKQRELEDEETRVNSLLIKARDHADDIEDSIAEVLNRTKTPHAVYLAGTPLERRILNQAFFKRILVGEDAQIVGVTLTPTYAAVAAWEPTLGQPQDAGEEGVEARQTAAMAAQEGESTNPGPFSRDQGLHFVKLVETAGIEPASAVAPRAASTSVAGTLSLTPVSPCRRGVREPAS